MAKLDSHSANTREKDSIASCRLNGKRLEVQTNKLKTETKRNGMVKSRTMMNV